MDMLEKDFAARVFDSREPPCISLYQPTHRAHPDSAQDPIRFRNLVKRLQHSLRQRYSAATTDALLAPFDELAGDHEFWMHNRDGLAILAAQEFFRLYRLQRGVPELALVANTFHLKPLLRILQSADRYQVLGLTRDRLRLFEGNRDALDEIEPAPEVPRTLVDALGSELTEATLWKTASGGTDRPGVRHGQGSGRDEVDVDAERYFRAVDRAVLEHHSQVTDLPLLLVALPENQGLFRRLSRNPQLLEQGIEANPDALELDELRLKAWRVIEPRYLARLGGFIGRFEQQHGTGLATDALDRAAAAAVAGRVELLLVEARRQVPGRIDADTGRLIPGDLADPEVDDVLDDLAELVMKKGGDVVVVPTERMPTESGAAAIFRY